MRLRLLVGFQGGLSLNPGDEHDFDDAEAKRLIAAGFGVPVAAPIERAVKAAPETRGKRKK